MNSKTVEQSILELLPQIPYIVDQVGSAMNWAKESAEAEGDYNKILNTTLKVAEYAARVSEPNFYKTHLIITSLLSNIPNVIEDEKFKIFDTASKITEKTLKKVIIDPEVQEKNGCFKALNIHLIPLLKEDQEAAVVMLCGIWQDLEEIAKNIKDAGAQAPITREDYVILLGYSLVVTNIYNSKINIYNDTNSILNEIQIILNGINY